jgi:hypothetical protein
MLYPTRKAYLYIYRQLSWYNPRRWWLRWKWRKRLCQEQHEG